MQKNILVIGIIWSILTVICLVIITGYDPIKSNTTEYANTIFALTIFQFIPSLFVVAYYFKTKSVQRIQYLILVLLYTYSFFVLLFMAVSEDEVIFSIILFLIPNIGFIIWMKSKLKKNTTTKNNHVKDKSKTEKNNSYDQLKKEIDEYEQKNQEIKSEEIKSEEIKYTQKGIADLLKLPESETLEFKSTLKWDIRQEKSNPALVLECVKTIAGFLNNKGGILIVGYDDDNNIIYGLEKDYPFTSKKQNYDGWQQYFINQINDKLGKTINHYFTLESISYNGKTLAKINVKTSPSPVFTKQDNNEGNFYVRIHGQTENLNPQETQKWISDHFDN
jgi:predicted HTH transcriptional regulator